MKKFLKIGLLFFLFIPIPSSYSIDLEYVTESTKQTLSLDSLEEEGKVYIHLPSLIIKTNGTINVQDNNIIVVLNGKNINIDFQNNIASINEASTTKLVQFQNPIKVWEDTIWIEFNDARSLIQYSTGGTIDIKNEQGKNDKAVLQEVIQETPLENELSPKEGNEEGEATEGNLLEKIPLTEKIPEQEATKGWSLNKIYIDVGHGGEDKGIIYPSEKFEKEITLSLALNLEEELKNKKINTILSRREDKFVSIKERCEQMKNEKVDYYISIHTASPRKEGECILIFVSKLSSDDMNSKNEIIADEIGKKLSEEYNNLKIKKISTPLILSDNTNIPGLLIEIYPEYADDISREKWDTFVNKKSSIYSIIADVLKKNMKAEKKNE